MVGVWLPHASTAEGAFGLPGNPPAYLLHRPWRDIDLPPDALGIPTMLSKGERRLLYALARDYAFGDAAIVDAGCFLGGSTAALLSGVRDRRRRWSGPPVASYDLFVVEPYTVQKFFADDPTLGVGASFRSRFDENVAGFDVPHGVYEGDIVEIGWPGGPIDILFVDLLKSWDVNDAVLRDFYPSLRPGRSVIVHQDYGTGWLPWIPITVELMGESLRLIDSMEWGSHVFFLQDDIPEELIKNGVRGLDYDTKLGLVDQAIFRSEGWVRGMLEMAKTELIYEDEGTGAALDDLAQIEVKYPNEGLVVATLAYLREGLETDWTFDRSAKHRHGTSRLAHVRRRLAAALSGR